MAQMGGTAATTATVAQIREYMYGKATAAGKTAHDATYNKHRSDFNNQLEPDFPVKCSKKGVKLGKGMASRAKATKRNKPGLDDTAGKGGKLYGQNKKTKTFRGGAPPRARTPKASKAYYGPRATRTGWPVAGGQPAFVAGSRGNRAVYKHTGQRRQAKKRRRNKY